MRYPKPTRQQRWMGAMEFFVFIGLSLLVAAAIIGSLIVIALSIVLFVASRGYFR